MARLGIFMFCAFGSLSAILECSPHQNTFEESLRTLDLSKGLVSAAGRRPIAARLTSWNGYAPFGKTGPKEQEVFRGALSHAGEFLRRGTPEGLRVFASLELVAGRTESAVLRYEELARQSPKDAVILSELAAAYLTLAEKGSPPNPLFRVHALAMADRAVASDPRLPAALFNRALALEGLYLWPEAIAAWQSYRSLDRSVGWSDEAQGRIEALEEKLRPKPWKEDRDRLDRAAVAGDAAMVQRIVTQYPQESRMYAEETVLAQWAQAEHDHRPEEAGRRLSVARALGTALEALHGDRLMRDAVAAIDRADLRRRTDLVRGHLVYRKGLDEYEPLHLEKAKPLLLSARKLLDRGGSPFAAWAAVHLAICDWYGSQYDRSLAVLKTIRRDTESKGYPALLGRVHWLEGISYFQKSLPTENLIALQKSLAIFEKLGEMDNVACLHERIALGLSSLGETEESWLHLDRALSLRRELITPRRFYSIFYTAQDLSLHLQEPSVSVYFFTEVVEAARRWASAPGLAEALWSRSRVRRLLGEPAEALADLREAEGYLPSIQDASLRRRIQGDISWVTAEARPSSDLSAAITDFTKALQLYDEESYPDHLIALYLERGRAYLQVDMNDEAEDDFAKAISLYEIGRQQIQGADFRVSFFDQADSAFNQMILFQLSRRGRPLRALDYVERARARVLLETVLGARQPEPDVFPEPLGAEAITERLPEGVALVEYAVLPDRLLTWMLSRKGIEIISQDLGSRRLTELVERLRSEIIDRRTRTETAQELFRILVQPALEKAPDASRLVFIPDKVVHELPFAALRNPATRRYLIEEKSVAVAPSATLYVLGQEQAQRRITGSEDKVLVVGNPAFDRTEFRGLDLPAAAEEARVIAGMYPGAHLLLGPQATKSAVLELASESTILHFAAHAIENRDAPSRSSIMLAPDPGDPDKGRLFASDLGRLRLARTRLVVLSACQTAEGRISRTEGAESLARAFLAAGVPAVVASLWPVEDRATKVLLTGFHMRIQSGLDPVRALQEAQGELITSSERNFQDPVSWAGFELIGGAASERR